MRSAQEHGYRNAQVSVVAPTGTIGLVMDCDTTGIEPDFALVKFKKLAGGGYFKIINRGVTDALRALGYAGKGDRGHRSPTPSAGRRSRTRRASTTRRSRAKGVPEASIEKVEGALKGAFDIRFVFNKWTLGAETLERGAENPGRALRGAGLRPALRARLHQGRDRGREHFRLRRHDPGGRASPEA